jgi:hypothetical protein
MRRLQAIVKSPLVLGLVLSSLFLLALLALETALDRWPGILLYSSEGALVRQSEGILRDLRIAVVHCLLAGYLPAALFAVVGGGRRTVLALQEALDCSREECERLAASLRFSPRGLAVVALLGLAAGLASPYIVPPVPEAPWNPTTWSAEVAWHRVLGLPIAAGGALLGYSIVVVSRRMSSLATDVSSIDVFDFRPLLPFTQQGLANALLFLGAVSIAGLMLLTETGFGLLALLSGGPVLVVAGMALVLPLRGVHRRIRQAKDAELVWVETEIKKRREALKTSPGSRAPGEFADLVAYRDLVRGVQEWPINASTYLRFAFYLMIPVVSWAAAALVERLVDVLVF